MSEPIVVDVPLDIAPERHGRRLARLAPTVDNVVRGQAERHCDLAERSGDRALGVIAIAVEGGAGIVGADCEGRAWRRGKIRGGIQVRV